MSSSKGNTSGMTLTETLVAVAIASMILMLMTSLVKVGGTVSNQSRAKRNLDDAMRATLEGVSQDVRASIGPRIMIAGSTIPSSLNAYTSTGTTLGLIVGDPAMALTVAPPTGYPGPSTARVVTYTTNTINLTQPNLDSKSCSDIFKDGDNVLITSDTQNYWMTAAATPCGTASLKFTSNANFTYSQLAKAAKVLPVYYSVSTIDGQATLTRQIGSGSKQVIDPDITSLTVEYSSDGANFSGSPPSAPATPKAIRITIAGTNWNGKKPSALTLSNTIFMRDSTIPQTVR